MIDILVVAGEASGDSHGAKIVAELKALRNDLRFFGMTGPKLEAQGVERIFSSSEIAVMGVAEVLPQLAHIYKTLRQLTKETVRRKPRLALLIDAQDFNARLARALHRHGITIVTLVAPTVWAWREGRTRHLRNNVNEVLCVLPFEEKFLRDRHVKATYIGSPVLDDVVDPGPAEHFRAQLGLDPQRRTLALLPGSRRSELKRILPVLVEVAAHFHKEHPQMQFVVPLASGVARRIIEAAFAAREVPVHLIAGQAPQVIGACDVAVVASGTATLEAGLMLRPLVAVYRLHPLTYWIGRALVKAKYFSLVNLILEQPVIPELLQQEMSTANIVRAVDSLWAGTKRNTMISQLNSLRGVLGPPGASKQAAKAILPYLDEPH
jgi:lipid-A-disaccharide synthase